MRVRYSLVKAILPLVAFSAASGCESLASGYSHQPAVDPAAVVKINRKLQIPNGRARVYLHEGKLVGGDAPVTWNTYCSLLMQTVHQPGSPLLTVEPDTFAIEEVREYNDLRHAPRIYVASARSMFEDWPANVVYTVEMRLLSPRQPGVRALICSRHSGAEIYWNARAYYPAIDQMRTALGEIIEIIEP